MGRRALRKIDPRLNLDRYFQAMEKHPGEAPPLDPTSWFVRQQPLEIDVGCGKGMFVTDAAAEAPDRNFLGIEIAQKYARFAAARAARRGVENACILHGDAERFFRESLHDASVHAVHVYFPDPWWKKRHHKRRIMNASFLAQVQRVLETQGRLHFWTDVEEYFRLGLQTVREATSLSGPLDVPIPDDGVYRTHFDRRTLMHNLPVYRAEFVR